jgi:DNA adenine methylase
MVQYSLDGEEIIEAKPFLKWVGGKRQLINEIENILPQNIKDSKKIDCYFEPFIGGGAVFFHLVSNYKIKKAFLFDINKELILVYNVMKKDPNALIDFLREHSEKFLKKSQEKRKKYYYKIRETFNEDLDEFNFKKYGIDHVERAAYTIFLNKTCFNGLFRLNKKGEFNVPMGKYKNPKILDIINIKNVSKALKIAEIYNCDFKKSEQYMIEIKESKQYMIENSLVYLDPPYRPLNKTSSFTSYSENEFNDTQQEELAEYFHEITKKGAKAILSNSDPKNEDKNDNFFDDMYSKYDIFRVQAKRFINSNAKKRGSINEIIVKNY